MDLWWIFHDFFPFVFRPLIDVDLYRETTPTTLSPGGLKKFREVMCL